MTFIQIPSHSETSRHRRKPSGTVGRALEEGRLFDLSILALAALPALCIGAVIAALLLVAQGRPVFFCSERMKTVQTGFTLIKFRTMRIDGSGLRLTGGDQRASITPIGRWLRRSRLDELPQLLNVLFGDMALVGPRPPLRVTVAAEPLVFAAVLRRRPGLTGLASLVYRRHETRLLATVASEAETRALYHRRCLPAKVRLDLIHQRSRTPAFDLAILVATLGGHRLPRLFRRSRWRKDPLRRDSVNQKAEIGTDDPATGQNEPNAADRSFAARTSFASAGRCVQ